VTDDDIVSLLHASSQSVDFHTRVVKARETAAMLAAGTLRDPVHEVEFKDLLALEDHFVIAGRRLELLAKRYPNDSVVAEAVANHQARKSALEPRF